MTGLPGAVDSTGMSTTTVECRRCGRTVGEHGVFHDPPDPATVAGMTEADFAEWHFAGLYCPPFPAQVRP